ncbi:hypothetical protein MBLNU459_g6941t1 [Dothideomycetes sp. NU459]
MKEFQRSGKREVMAEVASTDGSVSHAKGSQSIVDEMPLSTRDLWTPFCLRPLTLIALIIIMALMIAALEIIYQVSDRHQGLVSTSSNKHYLWTYGPTAIFTLVSSYWGQIAYHTALLMPWKAMQHGPVAAGHSLFVDYRSSPMWSTLWVSARNRHFPVLLAVFGTLLLLLETILSTGLFTLETFEVTATGTFMISTEQYIGPNIPFNSEGIVDIDGASVLATIGIMSANLSYPAGTNSQYAVQSFKLDEGSQNPGSSLTATVNGTSASLTCDVVPVDSVLLFSSVYLGAYPGDTYENNIAISINYTTQTHQLLSSGCFTNSGDSKPGSCLTFGHMGLNQNDTCWAFFFASYERPLDNSSWYDLFETTNRTIISSPHGWLNGSALLCQTNYTDGLVQAEISSSGALLSVVPKTAPDDNDGYWEPVIAEMVYYVVGAFQSGGALEPPTDLWGSNNAFLDVFFNVMAATIPEESYKSLLDPDTFTEAVNRLYSTIYAQLAKQYFFVEGNATNPDNATYMGTYETVEQRLVVHSASARILEAVLAVLVLVTISICLLPTASSTPVNPENLGGLACMLATSQGLISAMRYGAEPEDLSSCRTVAGKSSSGHSRIEIHAHLIQSPKQESQHRAVKFFTPFNFSLPVKGVIIVMPLVMIAVLETTFQVSKRSDGLVTVSSFGYEHFAWTLLPALLLSGLGIAYGSVASTVRSPFNSSRSDVFNISLLQNDTVYPDSSLYYANLVVQQNLSFPEGTYRNMLLPNFELDTDTPANTTGLEIEFQALRLNQTDPTLIGKSDAVTAYVTYPGLADCLCLQEGSNICVNVTPAIQFVDHPDLGSYASPDIVNAIDAGPTGYFDKDHCFSLGNSTQQFLDALQHPDPSLCPVYTLLWGYASNTSFDQIHGFTCTPSWELVNVTAKYSMPDFTLLSVDADEESAQPYDTTHWIDLIKEWGLYALPDISDRLIEEGQGAYSNNNNVLNTIFELLSPNSSALGQSNVNTDPATIMSAYERFYELFYIQYINIPVRDISPDNAAPFVGRPLVSTTRLIQSEISTRILESLLAILFICAVITFVLFDPRNLSPERPRSIATQAALLAGADELLGLVPSSMEKYDEKALDAIFDGYFYSLGWWNDHAERRIFGIGIGKPDADG